MRLFEAFGSTFNQSQGRAAQHAICMADAKISLIVILDFERVPRQIVQISHALFFQQ
jgi:hypothetical protein